MQQVHLRGLTNFECKTLSNSVHVAHATSFQRSAGGVLIILSSLHNPKRGSVCPAYISLFYFPLKPPHFPFSRHESQCIEPVPIRHLIVVPPCRDPFILPHSSESCDTSPNLLKYNIRKRQWHFGWHRECREEGRGHTTASPSTVRARSQTKDQGR